MSDTRGPADPEPQRAAPDRATATRAAHYWPIVSGIAAIGVVLLAGLLLTFREGGVEFDVEWMEDMREARSPWLEVPFRLLDFLGGGWFAVFVVPIGTAVALLIARRPWAALFFVAASAISAGAVQLIKAIFGRARPEDMLVASDEGSFPSGHVANAATIGVALALIFARTWLWWAGAIYALVMGLSRTYLGVHWLSDTIGGLVLGVGVAIIVWAPLARRLHDEREARYR